MQVMQWITAAILAAFVGYIAAWYTGSIEGNFALLLFLATVVTGVYWLAERFYFTTAPSGCGRAGAGCSRAPRRAGPHGHCQD